MKSLFVILFSLSSLWGFSQEDPVGPSRTKADFYFLKDAYGRIITTESGGILSVVQVEDTASFDLPLPPDTIQSFVATKAVTDTFTSLLSEIRSYWTLEESAGNAVDSVGTANLPVSGSVTREQTGKIGNCYLLSTNGSLGSIDTYYEFDQSFSFSCWIKTSESSYPGGWAMIMSNFGETNYGYELLTLDNGSLYWRLRYSGGNATITSSSGFNDNAWHHVVVSNNHIDDTIKLWIDGDLKDKDINTNGTWYSNDARMCIGSKLNYTAYYEGYIDEPAFWNKELTSTGVDSLFAESQYPFTGQGSGGDSLRIQCNGFDARADTIRVIANPIGAGKSDSRIDGTLLLAFNMADSADYNDTTIHWPYLKDTTYIIEAYTGLIPEDTWTVVPNYTTVLIDSSDISPPDQDIGVWDTIYYNDFEQHSAPSYYDRATFLSEWSPVERYASRDEYRASDYRSPVWFNDNLKDSIVIDETTGSKVMQVLWKDTIIDGYDGQSGRGGDYWRYRIDGEPYTEIYVSSNIMLRPGFDWAAGGKLCWGIRGGASLGGTGLDYGFVNIVTFGWDARDTLGDDGINTKGVPGFYNYYQDMSGIYGEWHAFGDFQPDVGTGRYNNKNNFVFDVSDSTWVNITVRCVTNTHSGSTPIKNGIFEGYINGHLVAQWSGLYLIAYPDIGNEINVLNWYQSFGGGGPPNRDEWIWNDDIWIFTYNESVDVPRGNVLSEPGRILSLPNLPKPLPPEE